MKGKTCKLFVRIIPAVLFGALLLLFWESGLLISIQGQKESLYEAKTAYNSGEKEKALEILRKTADRMPAAGDIPLWIARILIDQKKYHQALRSINRHLPVNKNHTGLLIMKARALKALERKAEAYAVYRAAADQLKILETAYLELADLAFSFGNGEEAYKYLHMAGIRPETTKAGNNGNKK
ncbi:MAG: hypothetical protein K9L68_02505 [Spirochaetales bacterium]|nr:hypothetical protein [Spirochaetales bacterium]MCF7937448.1 hypothetical protein [Spirochaetales bacterium]